ncbi:DNA polymerase iota isoform X2 [Pleurodeles waltl]
MSLKEAKDVCPQMVLINGEDLTPYREMSYRVTELLEEFCPLVERLGFDENFIDITEMVDKRQEKQPTDDHSKIVVSGHIYNNQTLNLSDPMHIRLAIGSQIVAEMRAALFDRLGLTGCAGVASNKLLSKLVGGTFKPNQQTILLPESHQRLIDSLDHINKVPGIGYKTSERLELLGIRSLRDLQTFPLTVLEKELGSTVAQRIQMLSCGEDNSPVTPTGPPQSLSDEDSFRKCSTEAEVKIKVEELLRNLLNRVYKDGRKPHTIRLTIRQCSETNKWSNRESRQCPVPSHIIQKLGAGNDDVVIPLVDLLMNLFKKMINVKTPFHLTLLNVCFSKLKSVFNSTKGSIGFYLTQKTSPSSPQSQKTVQKMQPADMEDMKHNISRPSMEFQLNPSSTNEVGDLQALPDGVDHDVFSQLPEDIKKEILSSTCGRAACTGNVLGRPSARSKGIGSFFPPKKVFGPSAIKKDNCSITSMLVAEREQSTLPNKSLPSRSETLIPTFVADTVYSVRRHEHAIQGDCSKQEATEPPAFLPPSDDPVDLPPDSEIKNIFHPPQCSNDSVTFMDISCQDEQHLNLGISDKALPSGVDPMIFSELPHSVQQELMVEWSQKNTVSKIHVNKRNQPIKTPKRKTTSDTPSQPNNLMKYFKPN